MKLRRIILFRLEVKSNMDKMVHGQFTDLISAAANTVLEGNYSIEVYSKDELEVLIKNGQPKKVNMKLDLDIDLVDNLLDKFTFENFIVGESNKESCCFISKCNSSW